MKSHLKFLDIESEDGKIEDLSKKLFTFFMLMNNSFASSHYFSHDYTREAFFKFSEIEELFSPTYATTKKILDRCRLFKSLKIYKLLLKKMRK